jgi:hypothetical protein
VCRNTLADHIVFRERGYSPCDVDFIWIDGGLGSCAAGRSRFDRTVCVCGWLKIRRSTPDAEIRDGAVHVFRRFCEGECWRDLSLV